MPWLEATPMDHRLQFVAEARRTDESFTALCTRYGIAPKTGYKWLARYEAEGPAGLHERSRRPHTSPTATPPAVATPADAGHADELGVRAHSHSCLTADAHPHCQPVLGSRATPQCRRRRPAAQRVRNRRSWPRSGDRPAWSVRTGAG